MKIDLDIDGAVATITLNDEATRNALHDEALVAIRANLDAVAERDDVTVVVIRGAGKAFSSGGSMEAVSALAELARSEEGRGEVARRTRHNSSLIERILQQPQLTVALMTGAAVGASLGIAGACDLRYAVPTARFLPGFGALGLTSDVGTSAMLRRAMGDAVAGAWLLLGSTWSADEAKEAGFIDLIDEEPELRQAIERLGGRMVPRDGVRVAAQRGLMVDSESLAVQLDREATTFANTISKDEAQHRIAQMLKRAASR
ncbi:MAG: enoyl-CoA hydratase/isomerase family protein [Gulosibacter sp.]|uniref:enoyl-CoA hydratase/isomerase family protein n=1 Tax=Gulosibacter sp. TaxID=2817531 RepID=UPI003F8FE6E5